MLVTKAKCTAPRPFAHVERRAVRTHEHGPQATFRELIRQASGTAFELVASYLRVGELEPEAEEERAPNNKPVGSDVRVRKSSIVPEILQRATGFR